MYLSTEERDVQVSTPGLEQRQGQQHSARLSDRHWDDAGLYISELTRRT